MCWDNRISKNVKYCVYSRKFPFWEKEKKALREQSSFTHLL